MWQGVDEHKPPAPQGEATLLVYIVQQLFAPKNLDVHNIIDPYINCAVLFTIRTGTDDPIYKDAPCSPFGTAQHYA